MDLRVAALMIAAAVVSAAPAGFRDSGPMARTPGSGSVARVMVRAEVVFRATAAGARSEAPAQALTLSHPALIFTGRTGGPDPRPQRLTIQALPAGATGWTVPTTLPAWLRLTPPAGSGPGDIALTAHVAGLSPGFYHVQLTVTSGTESKTVEIILVVTDVNGGVPAPGPAIPIPPIPPVPPLPPGITDPTIIRGFTTPARYLVEFMFIGYSGLLDGYPDCQVNPQGFDHMMGVLTGIEVNSGDEDITYQGVMHRYTEVDFCDVRPAPTEDQTKYCAADLHGEATMSVELEVYGEPDRGAWLKVRPAQGRTWRTVGGDCTAETNHAIETEYPNSSHGGGGSPGGQAITDLGNVKFFSGGVARLRVGDYPARDPDSIWSMRVIARLVP